MEETTSNNVNENDPVVFLEVDKRLQEAQILISFLVTRKTKCIIAGLNQVYDNKTIVSNIYQDWIKTIDAFTSRAKKKGISDNHIVMLTDAIDNNNEKIMQCLYDQKKDEDNGYTTSDRDAVALELVKGKTVALFLDEVKTPYAAIKVDEHTETMSIKSQRFEDWIGAVYYYHNKSQGHNSVLSKEGIGRIQSVFRFEANSKEDVKTLHIRVAAFVDTETKNLDENTILYDLSNKNWEIVKITRHGWTIEKNYPQILFKRFPIMNSQVYPLKDYPPDIMDQFVRLTNVYDDEDNKLLAEVYLVSLFLLANLPKPMMIPHGIRNEQGSW